MATLNQIRLPDELLRAIEQRAIAHGISVEEQLVRDLASIGEAHTQPEDAELVGSIRRDREALAAKGVHLTDELLKAAKEWGRK